MLIDDNQELKISNISDIFEENEFNKNQLELSEYSAPESIKYKRISI